MDENGDYDGTVTEISYTHAQKLLDAELHELVSVADAQLEENYDRKGDGWQNEDPRYHMWKGMDELFSATHHVDAGEIEQFEKRLGDGLNHLRMASFLAQANAEVDP